MIKEYRIRPDGFAVIRKRILLKGGPIMVVAILAGVLIPQLSSNSRGSIVDILPFMIPVTAGIVAFSLWSSLRKQKKLYESYVLTIEDNVITRNQQNTDEVTIYFHEIQAISKSKSGVIVIKGLDNDIIFIPAEVEQYEELDSLLGAMMPFSEPKSLVTNNQKASAVFSLVSVAAMFTVYVSDNKWLVGFAGPLAASLMIWNYFQIQKNKNVDNKTKKNFWLLLIVMASVLGVTILKLVRPGL